MSLKTKLLSVLLSAAAFTAFAQESFTPDLSGKQEAQKILNNPYGWAVSENVLRSPDYSIKGGMSSVTFKVNDLIDFDFSAKVRCIKRIKGDNHFGFNFRRGMIYSRGNSFILQKKGYHGDFGTRLKAPFEAKGDQTPWRFLQLSVKGPKLVCRLNGEVIAERNDLDEVSGGFSFYAYGCQLELSGISLTAYKRGTLELKKKSPNIALNSSFEESTLDGLPDYWGVSHWGTGNPNIILNYEEWHRHFCVDKTPANVKHGKQSLRIDTTNGKIFRINDFDFRSCNFQMKVNVPYTISFWMKADRPNATIYVMNSIFKPTPEWKRYELQYTRKNTSLGADMVTFYPRSAAVYWIDAVQIEEGTKATPYQPCSNDRGLMAHEGNVEKTIFEVPQHDTKFIDAAPALDGKLTDPVWKQIKPVEFRTLNNGPVKEKTFARLFYNKKGIYIGFDIQEKNSASRPCKMTKRDDFIWNEPSIEIFVDSKLSRISYSHLGFNRNGVQYDNDETGSMQWNGTWQVKTAMKADGNGWTAEVFLPFSDFGIDRNNGEKWGINLGRNNKLKNEISCWAPTYSGFHQPLRFGQIKISRDIQKLYFADFTAPKLNFDSLKTCTFSGILSNNTGKDIQADITATLKAGKNSKEIVLRKQVMLPNGKEIPVTFGTIPSEDAYQVSFELKNANSVLVRKNFSVKKMPMLTAMTRYNYVTVDKTLQLRTKFGFGDRFAKQMKLHVSIFSNGKEVFKFKKPFQIAGSSKMIDLPVKSLPVGKYIVKAQILYNGKKISEAATDFRKLEPSVHEVRIDRFSRTLVVKGKKVFPFGIFWEGVPDFKSAKFLGEHGINFIHTYSIPSPGVFRIAEHYGIMLELDVQARQGKNKEIIAKYKNEPAMLTWYTYDEAFTTEWGRKNLKRILKDIDDCREADPYHPVILLENRFGLDYVLGEKMYFPGDLPTIDLYVYPPQKSFQQIDTFSKVLMQAGEADGRPAHMVLFSNGYQYHAARDITPIEQECQTYMCIINGVRLISYWASMPKSHSAFKKIVELSKEVKAMEPALFSEEEVPEIKTNATVLRYTLKKVDNTYYLITVNTSDKPVQAKFDLSALRGVTTAEVMFENRTRNVNGTLSDTWQGYRRHVYKIK